MQPTNACLNPYWVWQQIFLLHYQSAHLCRRHLLAQYVKSATENVSRQVLRLFLFDQRTNIATQAALVCRVRVEGHRHFQNLCAQHKERFKCLWIEKFPRINPETLQSMFAHKFRD